MKKVLKYSGIISLILAAIAFILMMASPAVVYKSGSTTIEFGGTMAIFGGPTDLNQKGILLITGDAKLSIMALLAWILILVGMIIILLGVILPLLKVTALEKFAGVLNLIAVICLILGGVFMFLVVPTFFSANDRSVPDGTSITFGWVFGGILAIAGGVFAILPAAMDFIGKKKQLKSFH